MKDRQGSVEVWREEQLIWGVPQGNLHIDDTETRPEGVRILTMPLLGNGQGWFYSSSSQLVDQDPFGG